MCCVTLVTLVYSTSKPDFYADGFSFSHQKERSQSNNQKFTFNFQNGYNLCQSEKKGEEKQRRLLLRRLLSKDEEVAGFGHKMDLQAKLSSNLGHNSNTTATFIILCSETSPELCFKGHYVFVCIILNTSSDPEILQLMMIHEKQTWWREEKILVLLFTNITINTV